MKGLTNDEIAEILQAINTRDFPAIYEQAALYIGQKMPGEEITSSLQMRAAMCFVQGCLDFLLRDGKKRQGQWRTSQANQLRAAIRVLQESDSFETWMTFEGDGRAQAKRALWAMEQIAQSLERAAARHSQYAKNITLERCIGQQFKEAGWPAPSPGQVRAVARVLWFKVREKHPALADQLSRSIERDPKDARRAMR